MKKPEFRLEDVVKTVEGEAKIISAIRPVLKNKQSGEDRTFCSCNYECGCNPDCDCYNHCDSDCSCDGECGRYCSCVKLECDCVGDVCSCDGYVGTG